MGFVYYEQTCHLKGGSSLSTYENAGRISRVRSPCSGFEPTELDKDLGGDMLYDFAAQLPAVCCGACAQNEDCQGFAFAGDRCYLKANVSGTFPNPGSMASIKEGTSAGIPAPTPTPMQPTCPHFEPQVVDADLSGELLESIRMEGSATIDDCCPL